MTSTTARRARLLRLRTIEHRIAKAKLARADAALANLSRIARRIAALKDGLGTGLGETRGMDLRAMAEMSARLDSAQIGMTAPIDEAEARRAEFNALRIAAQHKEDSAEKLHSKAATSEAAARTLRADANRPHRKRTSFLETFLEIGA
jgi:hypothetical protein